MRCSGSAALVIGASAIAAWLAAPQHASNNTAASRKKSAKPIAISSSDDGRCYKRERELAPVNLRPVPYEFFLYFDL